MFAGFLHDTFLVFVWFLYDSCLAFVFKGGDNCVYDSAVELKITECYERFGCNGFHSFPPFRGFFFALLRLQAHCTALSGHLFSTYCKVFPILRCSFRYF